MAFNKSRTKAGRKVEGAIRKVATKVGKATHKDNKKTMLKTINEGMGGLGSVARATGRVAGKATSNIGAGKKKKKK